MAFHDEMQHLVSDLLSAYDARVKAAADIQADTRQTLSQFDTTLRDAAAAQQHSLQANMRHLRDQVASQRHQALERVAAHHGAIVDMATRQRCHLDAYARDLRASSAASMAGARQARRDASEAHRAGMNQFMQHLRDNVGAMKRDADQMMKGIADAQAASAQTMRAEMTRARTELADDVAGARQSIEAERAQLRGDQAAAQRSWQTFARTMRDRRSSRP